jgi:hypothetical protein
MKIGCGTLPTKWKSRTTFLVYGVGQDGVQAFTDIGIENLIELIWFYKANLDCSGGNPAAYTEWIPWFNGSFFETPAYRPHQTSSNSGFGRHETGSAIQRSMSDSCQPVPLALNDC